MNGWDSYDIDENPGENLMGEIEQDMMDETRLTLNDAESGLRRRPHLEDADWWVR